MFLAVADLPGKAEWVGEPHLLVVRCVRQEVAELLHRWAVADVVAQEAGIVVGELLANVVVHAQTTFRLEVQREGSMLRVEDGVVTLIGDKPARLFRRGVAPEEFESGSRLPL